MMKALKVAGALILCVGCLFLFIVNFSSTDTRFECVGQYTAAGRPKAGSIFMKLEEYRWWVGLWGDSAGAAFIEIPTSSADFFPKVSRAGDNLQIFDSHGLAGNYSKLSNTLSIKTIAGVFDGTCKPK